MNLKNELLKLGTKVKALNIKKTHKYDEIKKQLLIETAYLITEDYYRRSYHILNDLTETPKCKFCKNEAAWYKGKYREICRLQKCIEQKKKKTIINKYGVAHHLQHKDIMDKQKATNLNKYGVEFSGQGEKAKEKIKATNLKKYGGHPLQNEKVKESMKRTCLKKYGVDVVSKNEKVKESMKRTCLKKYGVDVVSKNVEVKEKINQTCIKRYGVNRKQKLKEEREKMSVIASKRNASNSFYNVKSGLHEETKLGYLGTYEKDFLDKFYDKVKISKAPIVKYFNEIEHNYIPDFFIKDLNLIVEIKSKWTYETHLKINKLKQKACLDQGFNFIFIMDKDYTEFKKLI